MVLNVRKVGRIFVWAEMKNFLSKYKIGGRFVWDEITFFLTKCPNECESETWFGACEPIFRFRHTKSICREIKRAPEPSEVKF